MLGNYFKVFLHTLVRQKVITLINVLGLSIGMSVCLLISLYVVEEYSYDHRWEKSERIARALTRLNFNVNNSFEIDSGAPAALRSFMDYFPDQIETGARVWATGENLKAGEDIQPGEVNYVDPELLDIFNFITLEGSLTDTLALPGRIALEQEKAALLFQGDALGKTLTLLEGDGTETDFEVTAIYQLPEGKGELLFSTLTLLVEELQPGFMNPDSDWLGGEDPVTWLLLNDGVNTETINSQMEDFVRQYVRVPWLNMFDNGNQGISIRLQAITDMHFNPVDSPDTSATGSRQTVNSFAIVAALVLLIAITNFVILSVARSAERVREIGVRKANGAVSRQLQNQFLFETLLQVLLAFCLALALYELARPLFETLMQTEIDTGMFSPRFLLTGTSLIFLITLLGGMYPSLVLSSASPESALKSGTLAASGSNVFRKVLVCFQFTIATGLIISTLVIYQQLAFVKQRDAGFEADNVVSLNIMAEQARTRSAALADALAGLDGVSLVSSTSRVANAFVGSMQVTSLGRERGSDITSELYAYGAGYDFFELYAMQIIAGRAFNAERDPMVDFNSLSAEEQAAFANKLVINESAVRDLGFESPESAIGESLYAENVNQAGESSYIRSEIIGVVADSQFDSLRIAPRGEMFRLSGTQNNLLSFHVDEAMMGSVRREVESIWADIVGVGNPQVFFGRDILAEQFRQEENEGRLLTGFAFLAILVSCMGLYGLVAFDTARRTKEIGMRKVLGGRHLNIQLLFLQEYFWPLLTSNLIAWPLSLWAMENWLQKFPYQIAFQVLVPICLVAGLFVVLIAGSTLCVTVRNAFRARPANALRYE